MESRSLSISHSFPMMTWVIMVQARCPDCCVTVWDWSSPAWDEKCSCYGRILCAFLFFPELMSYVAFARYWTTQKYASLILRRHSSQSWGTSGQSFLHLFFASYFLRCKRHHVSVRVPVFSWWTQIDTDCWSLCLVGQKSTHLPLACVHIHFFSVWTHFKN